MRKVLAGLLIFVLYLIFQPFLLPQGHKIVAVLLLGWVDFLQRTLPKVSINWAGIGMVTVCSLLILAALHSFCGWLARACFAKQAGWRWSSTFAIYGMLWTVFLTAMSVTGVVHQVAWLAASDQPWMVRSWSKISALRLHALHVESTLEFAGWDANRAWSEYWKGTFGREENDPQMFHSIFLSDAEGTVTSALVFFRDPAVQSKVQQFCAISPETGQELKPWSEIGKFLPRAGTNFTAGHVSR
jgi:hypothetical protein